jgi:hypothetical protein
MIELVLVYCLADMPDRCEERRQEMQESAGPLACTLDAQRIAGAYVVEHPKWRLATFRCEIGKPREFPA